MTKKLFIQAITRFLAGLAAVGMLLFIAAGTLHYPQGWLLVVILFVPMFIAGFVMMAKNPELLQKRLNVKEKESEQREVIVSSGIMFLAAFLFAGLSFRFGWLMLLFPVSIVAQSVIDTGLYGLVRHPMYMATVLLFLSMPLVLGSVISFVIMLCYIPIIVKRIKNEERVLEEGLPGYKEYKKKVKYRLIPFIW